MNAALLLIDLQNDYFPGGKMELDGCDTAVAKAGSLLDAFREMRLPVIHVQHLSARPDATFFLPGTRGADIHERVAPREGEPVVRKSFPNSFRATHLEERLKQDRIEELTIAGMMTHMCVDATVRAAADLGFRCQLAHDACATRDLAFSGSTVPARQVHVAFVAALNGLYAKVASTAGIIAAL